MKRKIDQFELTALLNDYTMIDYLDRFRMLATSLFIWKTLINIQVMAHLDF